MVGVSHNVKAKKKNLRGDGDARDGERNKKNDECIFFKKIVNKKMVVAQTCVLGADLIVELSFYFYVIFPFSLFFSPKATTVQLQKEKPEGFKIGPRGVSILLNFLPSPPFFFLSGKKDEHSNNPKRNYRIATKQERRNV